MTLETKMAQPPLHADDYNYVHGFLPPVVNAAHASQFPEQMIATLCHSLLLELDRPARMRVLDYLITAEKADFN
jgi:hypothetical protein